jgi:uncharacterized protein (UPF0335 family)
MSDSLKSPDLLKATVDRILSLREEEDALKADVRDVYAEAKSNGFCKTTLGRLVAEIRARQKNGEKVDEAEAMLELYRSAYSAPSHTHARERDAA